MISIDAVLYWINVYGSTCESCGRPAWSSCTKKELLSDTFVTRSRACVSRHKSTSFPNSPSLIEDLAALLTVAEKKELCSSRKGKPLTLSKFEILSRVNSKLKTDA